MSPIEIKRIYEPTEKTDGLRVLIDRLWPRGISKEKAQLAVWMKEIAPSNGLRTWFGHVPERYEEFIRRYQAELSGEAAGTQLAQLKSWAKEQTVTLLYSAKDEQYNQAVVLKEMLERDGDE